MRGLPSFDIVGLPSTSVNEAEMRIKSAMTNCKFKIPVSKMTLNLAPADVRKDGTHFDLPMTIALLFSSEQLFDRIDNCAFMGELSLDGSVRRVNGVLPAVLKARELHIEKIFIPYDNRQEASVVDNIEIYPVKHLTELVNHFSGFAEIEKLTGSLCETVVDPFEQLDFADVKGQQAAKRALEIAAAGGHNVIMVGPPGSGKSMLAKRIPSILPEMTFEESLQTTMVYSVAGLVKPENPLITQRPFRSPHHNTSIVGLSGGGSVPKPGEISLSNNGVLFLDELPEFSKSAMEALRQPVENNEITISRASGTYTYPSSFMLVCAMNPCPCGYYGHPTKVCTCARNAPQKYLAKISGPMLDRIDIHIEVPSVTFEEINDKSRGESSEDIRKRVNAARKIQLERYKDTGITCNAKLNAKMTRMYCTPTHDAILLLEKAFERLGLSARAYDKILRVARTIADLDNSEEVNSQHISEAIMYRSLDKSYWQN